MTIRVTDHGIGIKNSDKPNIFKLFGTIEESRKSVNLKGIGLGLVISKLIAEKFDGDLDFTSKYG